MKLLIGLICLLPFFCQAQLDIVVLGSGFKKPADRVRFTELVQIAKYEVELRLAYRKSQFVWHEGTPNNNFSCALQSSGTFGSPALVCDAYQAIYQKALETYADYDFIIVIVNKMNNASGNETPMIGSGNPPYAPAAFGSIVLHEIGHTVFYLGLNHTQGTIMGDATSQGQALVNMTFSASQQETVNQRIDGMAGTYTIDEPLDIHIESPFNGQIFNTSSNISVWVNTNHDDNIYKYQIIVTQTGDAGELIGEFTLWARNRYNEFYDIRRAIGNFPVGEYTILIRVFNIVGNYCDESVVVYVE